MSVKPQQQKLDVTHMSICSSLVFMISQSWYELRRRPCGYCVSFFSVLIVVAASAVSQSIIDRAPLIFLKSAEGPAAQSDMVLFPNPPYLYDEHDQSPQYLMSKYSKSQRSLGYLIVDFLNATQIYEVLGDKNKQASPRITQQVNVSSIRSTPGCLNSKELLVSFLNRYNFTSSDHIVQIEQLQNLGYGCTEYSQQAKFVALNAVKEKSINLGWEFPFGALEEGECILSKKLATSLGVKVGDTILIYGDFYDLYGSYYLEYYFAKQDYKLNVTSYNVTSLDGTLKYIEQSSQRYFPFTIKGVIDKTYGKFPDGDADKLIIVDVKHIFKTLGYWAWNADYIEEMMKASPYDFVDEIRVNIPNRFDTYMSSNYENIQQIVTKYASNINRDLGVYPVDMQLPVLEELYSSRYGQLFLGIILNMIIVILFVLSVILLYTLLLISVETKTYDLGVLRVLGFNKLGVIFLVITQAMSYVMPAIISGILLSIPLLVYASSELKKSVGVDLTPSPTPNAVGLALGLGFLIPLLSSYVPIKEALSKQLSFALDLQRSKSSAVKIDIDLEGKGLPWGIIQFATIASLFGICIYYFLPLALLSFNISLLLGIFFFILCGMLLGLIIMAFNVQYLVERLIVWGFLWWAGQAKKNLVLKNLAAHRIKNRRTALMYALSIAFVIFIYVGMSVQIANQSTQTVQTHGCYMEITSTGSALPIGGFEKVIGQLNAVNKQIENFAWVTDSLENYMQGFGFETVYMTHLGQVYQYKPKVIGVSASLFSLGFNDFLKVSSSSKTDLNPVEELYTARGSQSAIVGTSYADQLDLSVDQDKSFLLVLYNNTYSQYHEMRVSSILTTAPALKFSSLPSVKEQNVVVSLPTFRRLSANLIQIVDDLPMDRLLLQFSSDAQLDQIYLYFNLYIQQNGIGAKIWDYRDYESSISQSQQLISLIFNALTVIVMFLCFFSLMTSMSANMLEQVKEISILRAIGNTKWQISLVYVLEAFVLVFSSSAIGLVVGFIIGQSMALQQTLFTQLPLIFIFPWQMLLIVVGISVIAAIVSVILPSRQILKNEIAQIMRMN